MLLITVHSLSLNMLNGLFIIVKVLWVTCRHQQHCRHRHLHRLQPGGLRHSQQLRRGQGFHEVREQPRTEFTNVGTQGTVNSVSFWFYGGWSQQIRRSGEICKGSRAVSCSVFAHHGRNINMSTQTWPRRHAHLCWSLEGDCSNKTAILDFSIPFIKKLLSFSKSCYFLNCQLL